MRIIALETEPVETPRSPDEGQTGIRRLASGAWAAVVNGRLISEHSGTGSKLRAIREAGTNRVIV